jgi:Zn-dependent alcohol dehydrogenase
VRLLREWPADVVRRLPQAAHRRPARLGAAELTFSINELIRAGRTIKGNFAAMGSFGPEFAKLIKHYQDGALRLDALVSRQLDLSEVQLALDSMSDGAVARSVLIMSGSKGTV